MNKKLLTIIAGTAFAGSLYGGIAVSDDLTLTGYMDASYIDYEGKADAGTATTDFQEFELGFQFAPVDSPVSAVMELSFAPDRLLKDRDKVSTETATISYAFSDSLSVTTGNMLTYMGWETYDA